MDRLGTVAIVGGGLAGATAARALRDEGFDGGLVLVGDESEFPYDRPPLSKGYLRGEMTRAALGVNEPAWYERQSIDWRCGLAVVELDPAARVLRLSDGSRVRFDALLLATGAAPRIPDVPGAHLRGVHALRTARDADEIREAAAAASRIAVVGGGWIGAEVAASLRQLGCDVALVVPGQAPLERVLGSHVASVYRELHESHGVDVMAAERAASFEGGGRVAAVRMASGRRIPADLVVVGTGVEPRTDLATAAGLPVDGGIVASEYLETGAPGVFAAGDVAAAWHPRLRVRLRLEHWDNAIRQGRTAALNMLGRRTAHDAVPYFYSDQYDLGMEYFGHASGSERSVLRGVPRDGAFMAFWLRDGAIAAAMHANEWDAADDLRRLVEQSSRVDPALLADEKVPLGVLGTEQAA